VAQDHGAGRREIYRLALELRRTPATAGRRDDGDGGQGARGNGMRDGNRDEGGRNGRSRNGNRGEGIVNGNRGSD